MRLQGFASLAPNYLKSIKSFANKWVTVSGLSRGDSSNHPDYFDKSVDQIRKEGKDSLKKFKPEVHKEFQQEVPLPSLEDDQKNVKDNPIGFGSNGSSMADIGGGQRGSHLGSEKGPKGARNSKGPEVSDSERYPTYFPWLR
ncbi:hypothetical protein HDE_04204 [Halotydeus destructor]|nr:hypothetical protein HDE_04204 [Halotydeus destructor]